MEADINDRYLLPFQRRDWDQAVKNHELVNLLNVYFSESHYWNVDNPQILHNDVLSEMIARFSSLSDSDKLDFIVCFPYLVLHENPSLFFVLSTVSGILFEDADEYVARLAEEFRNKLYQSQVESKHLSLKLKHCELICATIGRVPPTYIELIEKLTDGLTNVLSDVQMEQQEEFCAEEIEEGNLQVMENEWIEYDDGLQFEQNFGEQWDLEQGVILEELDLDGDLEYIQEEDFLEDMEMLHQGGIIPDINYVQQEDPSSFMEIIQNKMLPPGVKSRREMKPMPMPKEEVLPEKLPPMRIPVKRPRKEIEPPPVLEKQCNYTKSQRNLIRARDEKMVQRQAQQLENEQKKNEELAKIREIIAREEESYRKSLAERNVQPFLEKHGLNKRSLNLLRNAEKKEKPPKKRDYKKEAERRRARKEALAPDLVHTMAPGGGRFEVLLDGKGMPVKRPPSAPLSPEKVTQTPICLSGGKTVGKPVEQNTVQKTSEDVAAKINKKPSTEEKIMPLKTLQQGQPKQNPTPNPIPKPNPETEEKPKIIFIDRAPTPSSKKRVVKVPIGQSGVKEKQYRRSSYRPYVKTRLGRMPGSRVITLNRGDVQSISSSGKAVLIRPFLDENGMTNYRVIPQTVRKGTVQSCRNKKTSPIEVVVRNQQSGLFRDGNRIVQPITLVPREKVEQEHVVPDPDEIPVEEPCLDGLDIELNALDDPLHQVDPVQTVGHEEEVLGVEEEIYEMYEEIEEIHHPEVMEDVFKEQTIVGGDQQMQMWPEGQEDQLVEEEQEVHYILDPETGEMLYETEMDDGNEYYYEEEEEEEFEQEVQVHNDGAMRHYRVTEEEYTGLQETLPDLFGVLPTTPEQLEDRYMMVAFIYGRLENPFPAQGNIYTIKVHERVEPIMVDDYETKQVVEIHFEMDFENVRWTRLRKTFVYQRDGIFESLEYLSEPENIEYVIADDFDNFY